MQDEWAERGTVVSSDGDGDGGPSTLNAQWIRTAVVGQQCAVSTSGAILSLHVSVPRLSSQCRSLHRHSHRLRLRHTITPSTAHFPFPRHQRPTP